MAKMYDLTGFTGSLSSLTAYKMRGVEGIILRTKGGPSKNRIKNSPRFESVRKNNSEFGGRSLASRHIMEMMYPLKALADYNIAGPINGLLKPLQESDTESVQGQRNIYVSRNPNLLQHFSLNRRFHFDSVVRAPVTCDLRRTGPVGYVNIPLLKPGIQLYLPGKYPFYGFVAVLGVVPDIIFKKNGYAYTKDCSVYGPLRAETAWFPSNKGNQQVQLEINVPEKIPGKGCTMMLTIGLRFGQTVDMDTIEQVKYAGMAKVLGVG